MVSWDDCDKVGSYFFGNWIVSIHNEILFFKYENYIFKYYLLSFFCSFAFNLLKIWISFNLNYRWHYFSSYNCLYFNFIHFPSLCILLFYLAEKSPSHAGANVRKLWVITMTFVKRFTLTTYYLVFISIHSIQLGTRNSFP